MPINKYLIEMRPKAWLKNIFVFVPLVFSLQLFDISKLSAAVTVFIAFCLISSSVYIYNDVCDAHKDALHPIKYRRPVASGMIGKPAAIVFAIACAALGLVIAVAVNYIACLMAVAYLAVNLFYSLFLKHKPIFDVFCISAGFVLRTLAGGFATNAPVSDWLFLTIVALSLFMAFGKRRGEIIRTAEEVRREVLKSYDLAYLNGMTFVCAGLSIVFYGLWTMFRGMNMIYTVPVIIFIVCRYLLIVFDNQSHGDPTSVIFSDFVILASCAVYAILTVILLYNGSGV
jgi:4-hydroxybenzoate polyprenyltransferase